MLEDSTSPLAPPGGEPKLHARKVRFDVISGPQQGLIVELPGPESYIGSGATCDLVLPDPTVSRLHAIVRIDGEWIRVTDAGSRNGTLLDGTRILDAYARPDSLIALGGTTLRLRMLNDMIELPMSRRDRMGGLLGRSVAMRRLFALLERVARTETTVLIEGETGTGKELVAEVLHEESVRAGQPYIVFDCSAASPTLIESELFGHMKGSFTGATADRPGAFEAANGGTLLLDEIGELPIELQPKLLRVLENREVRRVGSNVVRRVDVRVIAATNRTLAHEVDRGRFREDLYYRLAVLQVRLPPLRERLGDVPVLVRHFEAMFKRPGARAMPESVVCDLAAQSWPGNVRELRNAVARAVSLGAMPALPDEGATPAPLGEGVAVNLTEPLFVGRERVADDYERSYLALMLQHTGGNVSRAAELSQVNRKFIQRAMKRYGLRG